MNEIQIDRKVYERMIADYKNSLYVNDLLNNYLDGAESALNEYNIEWQKAIKKRNAWMDGQRHSFELAFEMNYPRETMIRNKQAHFTYFVSEVFNDHRMEKDTIGEVEIYYSLEANDNARYIGFYLLLSLYGYSGCRHAFVIAKSENGCEEFFPVTIDHKNHKITNQLLTAEIEKPEAFAEIITLCGEAIIFVEEKIGEKLTKNY